MWHSTVQHRLAFGYFWRASCECAQNDHRFMAELGKVVPILPIVTKSDSMTIREAATYRREVYRKLQNPQLPEPQGDILRATARANC